MDFEEKVRGGFYNDHHKQFYPDHVAWLVLNGVPELYAPKVASYAWQAGHAYGHHEVFAISCDLIEIFNPTE